MKYILENTETGETKEIEAKFVSYEKPWRVKSFVSQSPGTNIAVMATKWGFPTPQVLDTVRWLIGKSCPFCEEGTKVLRHLDQLGEERAKQIIDEILAAKAANDLARLKEIKANIWPSDQPT